jgi:hypothetical protein
MFNATEILISDFVDKLRAGYHRTYGGLNPDYEDIIAWAGSMALENIANSDALYHNVEHTILVALWWAKRFCGASTFAKGASVRRLACTSSFRWCATTLAMSKGSAGWIAIANIFTPRARAKKWWNCARGIRCLPDPLPRGSGQALYRRTLWQQPLIDAGVIKRNVELTRFPVPKEEDHQDTRHFPGLVRAADLIGQLSDPRYLKKIGALFYEFEETGQNKYLNYAIPTT